MDSIYKIIFVRHGRSRADDEGVHEGRYDSPLTEVGRNQAQRRALYFLQKGFVFDRIITSPLQRAAECARIISQGHHAAVEEDPDWMEIDNGPLQKLSFKEGERLYPHPAFRNPYQNIHGSGESQWQLYHRAGRAVEKILNREPGAYLVVAHGMVLNAALRTIVGVVPGANHHGIMFSFGDLGYYQFEYYPQKHTWWLRDFVRGD